ncbi:MAG: efflux RND transporter periplasmic adaptor subunit [Polyangiales bacterium]
MRRTPPLVAALALLGACESSDGESPSYLPPAAEALDGGALRAAPGALRFLTVETFGERAVPALVRAPGRVTFRDGAVSDVGAPVAGRVTAVAVALGQRVRRGDPLLTIASQTAAALRAEVARNEVLLRAAQAEAARQRQMVERGVGVASDLAAAEARAAEARALLAGLRSSLGTIGQGAAAGVTVRAPIDGVVLARNASPGLAVEPGGAALFTLGEPSAVRVVAEVFERDLSLVREGAAAAVSLPSLLRPLSARVEAAGASVDPETRRAPVYLTAPDGAAALRAGMFATVTIEAAADAAPGLPVTAVLVKGGERTAVYVATGADTFEPREVRVGHPVDGRVPILAGLSAGERVVTRGALLLDGAAEILR